MTRKTCHSNLGHFQRSNSRAQHLQGPCFNSQEIQELIKCIPGLQCKSLWIKVSAKYINVNVRPETFSKYVYATANAWTVGVLAFNYQLPATQGQLCTQLHCKMWQNAIHNRKQVCVLFNRLWLRFSTCVKYVSGLKACSHQQKYFNVC